MGDGFFPNLVEKEKKTFFIPSLPQCHLCGLDKGCRSPKMPVSGKGKRKILICGESPGKNEDLQGKPFVGESGKLLEKSLLHYGVELREDCWIANALRCRPSKTNEIKDPKAIEFCRPNLVTAIKELQPEVIIPLGSVAVQSLLPIIYKAREDEAGINRWVGWQIPCQKFNCWVTPNYHPSHLLHSGRGNREDPVLRLYFEKFLEQACSLEGRPWKKIPDYKKKVTLLYSSEEACRAIQGFQKRGKEIAWDLETDRLKPDSRDSKILCCSVSDGKETVAYPWNPQTAQTTKELVLSGVPQIASNCKFETRWFLNKFGMLPRKWSWDTMLTAHILDNRPGVSGIKFLSFVHLGVAPYNEEVENYIAGEGGNGKNKLHDFPMDKLLFYCGMDSLLEWQVAQIQRREFSQC